MHASRSESSLPPAPHTNQSRPSTQQSSRLTPVKGHRRPIPNAGGRTSGEQEEKQPTTSGSWTSQRLVDSTGRPISFDAAANSPSHGTGPYATTPTRSKVDADGLPLLSILSPVGLKAQDGDMSAILLGKVKKQSQANLAVLSAAKGSPIEQQHKAARLQAARSESLRAAELVRSGVGRREAYQPTGVSTGRPTLVSDARSAEIEAPSSFSKLRVSDFTHDGGMGGRVTQGGGGSMSLSMDMPLDGDGSETGGQGYGAARRDGPQHLHALSSGVGEKSAKLRSQLRGLDLLSTAFGQLIEEVGGSKGNLARLLTRVRDNYRLLFSNLIDTLLEINTSYHTSLKGCVQDYKSLQLRMDGKVAHLEHRVRLLTSISTSKDNLIELGEDNISILESEMKELKDSVILNIKSATLKVEQASNAIIQDSVDAQKLASASAAAAAAQAAALQGNQSDSTADGAQSEYGTIPGSGTTFATGSSVDALTTLSHESRNLTFELSELIQSVETQQSRSAQALGSLDALLETGVTHVEDLALHAEQKRRFLTGQNKLSITPSNGTTGGAFIPPTSPQARQPRPSTGTSVVGAESIPMHMEPATPSGAAGGSTPASPSHFTSGTPRTNSASSLRGSPSPSPTHSHGAGGLSFGDPSDPFQPSAGSLNTAGTPVHKGRTSRTPSLAPLSPGGSTAKERGLAQEALLRQALREQLAQEANAAATGQTQ